MDISPDLVAQERTWIKDRANVVVPIINDLRETLGDLFNTDVAAVTNSEYRSEVDVVFETGEVAVNIAGLTALLRQLDVEDDYPGFVVDELLGRELAAMIAGNGTFRVLSEATFHFADIITHTDGLAGEDDLDAALAAGFQTRLPGWQWTTASNPFAISNETESEN